MNKKREVDLHMHSDHSDGHDSPAEVVLKASKEGIKIMALTDHDTMKGIEQAIRQGAMCGVTVIPSVEVSTTYQGALDVHVLGINVNHQLGGAEDLFERNNIERIIYTKKLMHELNKLGILNATFDELDTFYAYPGYCVTLLHAADFMVHHEGRDFQFARDAVFETDKLGISRDLSMILSMKEGVKAILELGGIPILAHPGEFEKQIAGTEREKRTALIQLLTEFKSFGGKGIEAFHSKHGEEQEKQYESLAKSMGLAVTAGSDYHGRHKLYQEVGRHGMTFLDVLDLIRG